MFMARLMDIKITKIVDYYEKEGTFKKRTPKIVPPPNDIDSMNEALKEQLKKEYGNI